MDYRSYSKNVCGDNEKYLKEIRQNNVRIMSYLKVSKLRTETIK